MLHHHSRRNNTYVGMDATGEHVVLIAEDAARSRPPPRPHRGTRPSMSRSHLRRACMRMHMRTHTGRHVHMRACTCVRVRAHANARSYGRACMAHAAMATAHGHGQVLLPLNYSLDRTSSYHARHQAPLFFWFASKIRRHRFGFGLRRQSLRRPTN